MTRERSIATNKIMYERIIEDLDEIVDLLEFNRFSQTIRMISIRGVFSHDNVGN